MLTPIFLLPFGHSLLGLTDSLLPCGVIPRQRSALSTSLGCGPQVRELLADLFWGQNAIDATQSQSQRSGFSSVGAGCGWCPSRRWRSAHTSTPLRSVIAAHYPRRAGHPSGLIGADLLVTP